MVKVAIIGPESTGKSALSKELADHYQTVWVPEYAREYLDALNRPYQQRDLLYIAKGQVSVEDRITESSPELLICDTNLIVIKIWSDFIFGNTDPWIEHQLKVRPYDHHLLTDIDLPWEKDPLREHPDKRKELFNLYYSYLSSNDLSFTVIGGIGSERTKNAILQIERIKKG